MRVPDLYKIRELLNYTSGVARGLPDGSYGPTRGLGFDGICLKRRISVAWRVFKGELDAVKWED